MMGKILYLSERGCTQFHPFLWACTFSWRLISTGAATLSPGIGLGVGAVTTALYGATGP